MERLHPPNEFVRIRRLDEGMRAWEELWRLLADDLPPVLYVGFLWVPPAPDADLQGFCGDAHSAARDRIV